MKFSHLKYRMFNIKLNFFPQTISLHVYSYGRRTEIDVVTRSLNDKKSKSQFFTLIRKITQCIHTINRVVTVMCENVTFCVK